MTDPALDTAELALEIAEDALELTTDWALEIADVPWEATEDT